VHWVSRGWDVLVVDPRGSTGHGRAFQQALNGAWGRLDVDDTAALVRHAHDEGWATPETTVAIGGSAGGLTVLGLLADYPDIVAGGVAAYPVSDLVDLANTDYRFEAHYTETLVGPTTDSDLYQRLSPLNRADQIAGPLLLFHGADDPVVPVAQTELLAERIRSTGGDVECVIYEGEGHGFRHTDNQRDEYERTERFIERVTSTA
jgi:dipeptidyl aminopeptidase/acylaminoacyl peptidase